LKENYELLIDSKYSEIKLLLTDIKKNKYSLEEQKQKFNQNCYQFTIYFYLYELSDEILKQYKNDDLHELSSEEKETVKKIKKLIKFLNDIKIKEIYEKLKEQNFEDKYKKLEREKRNNNNKIEEKNNKNIKDEIKIIKSGNIKDLLEYKKNEIEEIEKIKLLILQSKVNLIKIAKSFQKQQCEMLTIEDKKPYKPVKITEYNEEKPKNLFKEFKYNKEVDQSQTILRRKKILYFVVAIVIIVLLIGRLF